MVAKLKGVIYLNNMQRETLYSGMGLAVNNKYMTVVELYDDETFKIREFKSIVDYIHFIGPLKAVVTEEDL